MRALAMFLLASTLAGCGARSRSADEDARRSLPPVRSLPSASASAPKDAGSTPVPAAPEFPRLVSLDAFGEGDRIADLAALGLTDRILLAWVTYFDPNAGASSKTPRKGPRPPSSTSSKQGASVMVRALDQSAEPLGAATAISVKAEFVGGVALAESSGEAALAWVSKDRGVGQVFVTKVSASGEKKAQRMVTRSKSDCSDVVLAAAGGQWIVAWIESHDGYSDISVAKLGKDLARIGSERRIALAQVKGEVSELRMIVRRSGDEIVLAWNEARTDAALSGIFAARLIVSDLAIRGDPGRVGQAAPHARGLELAPLEEGVVLAWIEDDTKSAAGAATSATRETPRRAMVLTALDPSLRPSSEPARPSLGAEPSSIALDCDRGCRVVVPSAQQDQLQIHGFAYRGGPAADVPARLASISGASTEDVSPTLVGDWLFFAEDNLHGGGRLRRAKIAWR